MPRPKTISDTKLARIIVLCGGMKSATARMARISRQALDNRLKANPALEAHFRETREVTLDIVEAVLIREGKKGRPWAIEFYLTRKARHRGWGERLEISTAPNSPSGFVVIIPGSKAAVGKDN